MGDCAKSYSEGFAKAKQFLFAEAEKLIELERQLEVTGEEDTLDKRLNMKFYESVYDWAEMKSFASIIEDTGIEEGVMVKMLQSLMNICRHVSQMATVVGDNTLADRLTNVVSLIDRGIVKM